MKCRERCLKQKPHYSEQMILHPARIFYKRSSVLLANEIDSTIASLCTAFDELKLMSFKNVTYNCQRKEHPMGRNAFPTKV